MKKNIKIITIIICLAVILFSNKTFVCSQDDGDSEVKREEMFKYFAKIEIYIPRPSYRSPILTIYQNDKQIGSFDRGAINIRNEKSIIGKWQDGFMTKSNPPTEKWFNYFEFFSNGEVKFWHTNYYLTSGLGSSNPIKYRTEIKNINWGIWKESSEGNFVIYMENELNFNK